jgi:hypothetical protein
MLSNAEQSYRAARLDLYLVEREIDNRTRYNDHSLRDFETRIIESLEAKAARMRIALIPLKLAAEAEPKRTRMTHSTDISFPPREWRPAGTLDLAVFDFLPPIPSCLRRVQA